MVLGRLDRGRTPRCHLFCILARAGSALVGSFGLIPTVLQANKAVIKTRIGKHGHNMSGRGIAGDHSPRIQVKDADIVLAVERYELVGTESEFPNRGLPRWLQCDAYTLLAVDIYEPCPEL